MLFNSVPFALLLVTTFTIYYLPFMSRWQVQVLTIASFVFYAYEQPLLLLLLLTSIAINVVTSYLVTVDKPSRKRLWAVLGVSLNLSLLLFFKYSPMFARTFLGGARTSVGQWLILIPLPIGISFFTFQGISLVVEVFRDQRKSADQTRRVVPRSFLEHLRNTALFKSFFPYLIAGPIVKAHEFYPQIGAKKFRDINWHGAFRALVIGYFLKMVLADNLKDATFWITYPYFLRDSTLTLIVLIYGYAFQVFADFAGYSSIAIGLGYLFGYNLPTNFNFPYLSKSLSEFWRRWHISLSTWLRDYLYYPLGGNRRGEGRTYLNLFIVMFLGGLWHGAAWSYAVWGTFHGAALAFERMCGNHITLPTHWTVERLQTLAVFSFFSFALLLFKLPKFDQAVAYMTTLFNNHSDTRYLVVAAVVTFSVPVVAYYAWHVMRQYWDDYMRRFEPLVYGALVAAIILNSGSPGRFVYFQF